MRIWIVVTQEKCEGTDFSAVIDAQAFYSYGAAVKYQTTFLSSIRPKGISRHTLVLIREIKK